MTRSKIPPHLSDAEVHVIISTLSGTQKALSYFNNTLSPFLQSHDIRFQSHTTESTETVSDLTTNVFLPQARRGIEQTIILLSGDGGVIDIINALASAQAVESGIYVKPAIALIPMGTANALAHSARVATLPLDSTLLQGKPRPLPIFKVTTSAEARLVTDEGRGRLQIPNGVLYGAVVFSWGLHASLVAESDTTEMRKHGVERFKMAAQKLLKEGHKYRGDLKVLYVSQEEWEMVSYSSALQGGNLATNRDHCYVLATLVSNLEENFCISPETNPLDGKLRLVAIEPVAGEEIMRILGLAYQGGQHVKEKNVIYKEIQGLKIHMHEDEERWRMVCVDGTIVAVEKDGWVEIRMLYGEGKGEGGVVELIC